MANYLRYSIGRFYLNLGKDGDWEDMPHEKERVVSKDKKGRNHASWKFKFDKDKVISYLKEKFNE